VCDAKYLFEQIRDSTFRCVAVCHSVLQVLQYVVVCSSSW